MPALGLPTDSTVPAVWLPADVPFVFTGPDLLVQVDVQMSSPPVNTGYDVDSILREPATQFGWRFGRNCSGAGLSIWYTKSQQDCVIQVGPASTTEAYFVMLGVDSQRYGSLNLPLDLGPILGMTGCDLGVAPLVTLPVPPFGLGSRFLSAKIPRPATGSAFPLFAQVLHTGPGPVGLYTTQVISIVLGDSESVNTVSSSTTFTGTAQFGPAVGYSSGPVLLLR